MKKGVIGFFVGFFVLVVIFCVVTLILANEHGVTFAQEIVSWFETTKEVAQPIVETTSSVGLL